MNKEIKEKELKKFKELNIIDDAGNLDFAKYQKWFIDYVNNELNNGTKLMDIVEAIENANEIASEATDGIQLKNEIKPLNGLFTKDELTSFVLKRVDEKELQKETIKMVKEYLDAKPEGKDEEGQEYTEPLKEEKIETIKNIITPLFIKTSNNSEQQKAVIEEFKAMLEEEGFKEEEVAEVLNTTNTDPKLSQAKARNVKPYNPYNDFRYIYYMWTLGVDYSRFAFKPYKPLDFKKDLIKLIDDFKKELGFKEPKEFKTSAYDMDYYKDLDKFNREYGLKLDVDELRGNICSDNKNSIKKYFTKTFTKCYEDGKSSINDSVSFLAKLDALFGSIALAEGKPYKPYAGIDNDDLKNMLIDLREKDCNLILKVKTQVEKDFGPLDKANPSVVFGHLEREFRAKFFDAKANDARYEPIMREAVACYKVLKDLHDSRGVGFKLFNNRNYGIENQYIRNMEALITTETRGEKIRFIRDLIEGKEIYKEGYKEELERIQDLSLSLAKDSFEIIESKEFEKTCIEIDVDKEVEAIKEAQPEAVNEIQIDK